MQAPPPLRQPGSRAQKLKPAAAKDKNLAAAGQKLWRGGNAATGLPACAGCHGQNGAGDTAIGKSTGVPDLRSSQVQSQPDSRLADVIENGTSRMPPFKSTLNEDQVKKLIAYVRALAKGGGAGGG